MDVDLTELDDWLGTLEELQLGLEASGIGKHDSDQSNTTTPNTTKPTNHSHVNQSFAYEPQSPQHLRSPIRNASSHVNPVATQWVNSAGSCSPAHSPNTIHLNLAKTQHSNGDLCTNQNQLSNGTPNRVGKSNHVSFSTKSQNQEPTAEHDLSSLLRELEFVEEKMKELEQENNQFTRRYSLASSANLKRPSETTVTISDSAPSNSPNHVSRQGSNGFVCVEWASRLNRDDFDIKPTVKEGSPSPPPPPPAFLGAGDACASPTNSPSPPPPPPSQQSASIVISMPVDTTTQPTDAIGRQSKHTSMFQTKDERWPNQVHYHRIIGTDNNHSADMPTQNLICDNQLNVNCRQPIDRSFSPNIMVSQSNNNRHTAQSNQQNYQNYQTNMLSENKLRPVVTDHPESNPMLCHSPTMKDPMHTSTVVHSSVSHLSPIPSPSVNFYANQNSYCPPSSSSCHSDASLPTPIPTALHSSLSDKSPNLQLSNSSLNNMPPRLSKDGDDTSTVSGIGSWSPGQPMNRRESGKNNSLSSGAMGGGGSTTAAGGGGRIGSDGFSNSMSPESSLSEKSLCEGSDSNVHCSSGALDRSQPNKLVVRIFRPDRTTKAILIEQSMTAGEVANLMIEKNFLQPSTNLALVEKVPALKIERVFEEHDRLADCILAWPTRSQNMIFFEERNDHFGFIESPNFWLGEDFTKVHRYNDSESIQAMLNNLDQTSFPEWRDHLYIRKPGDKTWSRRLCVLRSSGLYTSKKNKKTLNPADLIRILVLDSQLQLYTTTGGWSRMRAPTPHGFAFKSYSAQDPSSMHIFCFCATDENALRHWICRLRIAKYGKDLLIDYHTALNRVQRLITLRNLPINGGTNLQRKSSLEYHSSASALHTADSTSSLVVQNSNSTGHNSTNNSHVQRRDRITSDSDFIPPHSCCDTRLHGPQPSIRQVPQIDCVGSLGLRPISSMAMQCRTSPKTEHPPRQSAYQHYGPMSDQSRISRANQMHIHPEINSNNNNTNNHYPHQSLTPHHHHHHPHHHLNSHQHHNPLNSEPVPCHPDSTNQYHAPIQILSKGRLTQ